MGHSPHHILRIPANAASTGTGTCEMIHFAFQLGIVHNVIQGFHHAVEAQDFIACEI
ncbi:hypothetical protein SDC9_57981 [bioreactor metagenome]|uniref:Uncharacterized protein n=1 Tax=bioreactor metagenome TaxID=1076179 RepID=A0A644XBS6_9ZZZZ